MELLSYLGTVPKRRKDLEGRAQELLSGRSSVEEMEDEMRDRNLALVERLRQQKIRFTEFQRIDPFLTFGSFLTTFKSPSTLDALSQ
jgi:Mg-chelatase subunit ChlI